MSFFIPTAYQPKWKQSQKDCEKKLKLLLLVLLRMENVPILDFPFQTFLIKFCLFNILFIKVLLLPEHRGVNNFDKFQRQMNLARWVLLVLLLNRLNYAQFSFNQIRIRWLTSANYLHTNCFLKRFTCKSDVFRVDSNVYLSVIWFRVKLAAAFCADVVYDVLSWNVKLLELISGLRCRLTEVGWELREFLGIVMELQVAKWLL